MLELSAAPFSWGASAFCPSVAGAFSVLKYDPITSKIGATGRPIAIIGGVRVGKEIYKRTSWLHSGTTNIEPGILSRSQLK
jgi:hypothetical protein